MEVSRIGMKVRRINQLSSYLAEESWFVMKKEVIPNRNAFVSS